MWLLQIWGDLGLMLDYCENVQKLNFLIVLSTNYLSALYYPINDERLTDKEIHQESWQRDKAISSAW